MARSLTSFNVSDTFKATVNNAINSGDPATRAQGSTINFSNLATGTGANQADRFWEAIGRTLNSAASEDLDLYDLAAFDIGAGAGKDALGLAMSNAELVGIRIYNYETSIGNLIVGGKNTGAAFQSIFAVGGTLDDTAQLVLKPGALFSLRMRGDPAYAIADSTNHLLTFLASGGNCTFDVAFMARSA